MKEQLERIIKECVKYGIPVQTDVDSNGELCYRVSGFSKSGEAELYVEDDAIVCKTRYDRIDHIITFSDLAYIAYEWFDNYKNREPFTEVDPNWVKPFEDYRINQEHSIGDEEDLPF